MRLKALGNTNLEALWQIKKERDARRSKTPFLPIYKNGRRVELVQKLIMSKGSAFRLLDNFGVNFLVNLRDFNQIWPSIFSMGCLHGLYFQRSSTS